MPRPQLQHFAVTMPDGTVIPDVPEGTTQEQLWSRYQTYLAQKQTPIESATAKQEQATAMFQAQKQQEYSDRMAAIRKYEAEHPDQVYGQPELLALDREAVDPYLQYRKPPLPPSPVQKFGTTAKIDLVDDELTKRRIMADSLFPKDPEGINRVGFFDGKPVYVDDNGDMQQLSSGWTRFGASNLANAPETAGAIAGSLSGPWWGAPTGAMAMHAGKRYIASKIFDEPLDPVGLAKSTAVEGVTALGGDVLGRVPIGLYNKGRYIDMTPGELRAAEKVRQQTKADLDIDLDLAQAAGNRRLIAARGFAARSPTKAADKFETHDLKSAGQFEDATRRVLDTIATEKNADVAGLAGTNAAERAIMTAKREVSNKVRPDYEAAYAKMPVVTDPKILEFLKLPYFPEAFKRGQIIAKLEENEAPYVTTKVPQKFTREKTGAFYRMKASPASDEASIQVPDLRALDNMKQGLDDVIEELRGGEKPKLKLAGALQRQRDAFVDALDKITPEYAAAREKYKTLHAAQIAPLENGPVGVLARIKDRDAATAAAQIFSDENVSPAQIALARRAIQAQSPQTWNDLVRSWLGYSLNAAKRETKSGAEVNVPGKFRNELYDTPQQRLRMREMLPPDSVDAFEKLMDAAKRLGSTPVAGSVTRHDTEFANAMKGRAASAFKWLSTPRKKVIDLAEQEALDRGTVAIADALLDPAKVRHLRRVLLMRPSTQRTILLSTIIGAQQTPKAVDAAYPHAPDSAPFATEDEDAVAQ